MDEEETDRRETGGDYGCEDPPRQSRTDIGDVEKEDVMKGEGKRGGRKGWGLQKVDSTVENRTMRMGSTKPFFVSVLTRRRIAKMIGKSGVRKMRIRMPFCVLLTWSFRRRAKGTSMTIEVKC